MTAGLLLCLITIAAQAQQKFDPYEGPTPVVSMTLWTMIHGDHPRLVLYENGQLIFVKRDWTSDLPRRDEYLLYHHVKLDPAEVKRFVERAAQAMAGVEPCYTIAPATLSPAREERMMQRYAETGLKPARVLFAVSDAPTSEFYVRQHDRARITSVYGLFHPKSVPTTQTSFLEGALVLPPELMPEQLRQLHKWLWELNYENSAEWIPKYIEVYLAEPWWKPTHSVAWPAGWPDLNSARAIRQEYGYSIFVDGAALQELRQLIRAAGENGTVVLDGQTLSISYRYVFPGEPVWKAAHENRNKKSPSPQLFYAEDGLLRHIGEEQPASGKVVDRTDDGRVVREMTLERGRMVGEFREYHFNGQVEREMTFADGQIDGELREYHSNGQLRLSASYKSGKEHGPYAEYDEYGTRTKAGQFEDGVAQGSWTETDFRGITRRQYTMLDGKLHGHEQIHNGRGELIKENWYDRGEVIRRKVHKPQR